MIDAESIKEANYKLYKQGIERKFNLKTDLPIYTRYTFGSLDRFFRKYDPNRNSLKKGKSKKKPKKVLETDTRNILKTPTKFLNNDDNLKQESLNND